jgi:DNA-binding MarR family transcriptional regulator
MTGLLDSLERRGFVRRQPHGSDRRMLLIELTDAGRAVAQTFRERVHQQENAWLAGLSEAELDQFISTLQRIQAALGEAGEGDATADK